jgi:hypothetical protein
MLVEMTAIIDNDVRRADLADQPFEELGVSLAALVDFDPIALEKRLIVDIYAMDDAIRKVTRPHAQRSAAGVGSIFSANADFEDVEASHLQRTKMVIVVLRVPMSAPFVTAKHNRQFFQIAPVQTGAEAAREMKEMIHLGRRKDAL